MALSDWDKTKIGWYEQEKLNRGYAYNGDRDVRVTSVYQMSAWDDSGEERTYVKYSDGNVSLVSPGTIRRCQAALYIVPEDFVLGKPPKPMGQFVCMWCGQDFDAEPDRDSHEGGCDG